MKSSPILILFFLFNPLLTIAEEARIAAASSLTFVLEEIVDQFQKETGHKIKISFASSGTLTRQIEQGAPFELFLSADESYIERLHQQKLTHDRGELYAYGQLAIVVPNKQKASMANLSMIAEAVDEKSIKHLSIPNPELAPYGKIAKQALERAELWDKVSPILIIGENASQAAMFMSTGSVDAALLPHSLAMVLQKKNISHLQLVSEDLYDPLNHRMVLLKHPGKLVQAFYNYLLHPETQKKFHDHGFGTVNKSNSQ